LEFPCNLAHVVSTFDEHPENSESVWVSQSLKHSEKLIPSDWLRRGLLRRIHASNSLHVPVRYVKCRKSHRESENGPLGPRRHGTNSPGVRGRRFVRWECFAGSSPAATRRGSRPRGQRMITAHIHAELIAAFLGDDEPRYGECQCAPCRTSRPRSDLSERGMFGPHPSQQG
jgi:hypothetical protein